MEKILTGIILLYALFVAVYLTWLRAGRIRKKHIIGRSGSYPEDKRLKSDIVGKSRFKLSSSMPPPTRSHLIPACRNPEMR